MTDWEVVQDIVERAMFGDATMSDPTVVAYMLCRAALDQVAQIRSAGESAQIAYRLGDEFGAPR